MATAKADFYRALEATHPGAFDAFQRFAFNSPAWLEPETRIAFQVDTHVTSTIERTFLAFATWPSAHDAPYAPGLGMSAEDATQTFATLAAASEAIEQISAIAGAAR